MTNCSKRGCDSYADIHIRGMPLDGGWRCVEHGLQYLAAGLEEPHRKTIREITDGLSDDD